MIILPKNMDIHVLSNHDIEEAVYFILLNQAAPLRIKQLIKLISQYWGRKYTYKGMKDVVRKLVKRGVVEEIHIKDEPKFRYKYVIDLDTLEEMEKTIRAVTEDYRLRYKARPAMEEVFSGKTLIVNSIKELDIVLEEAELYWLENIREDEKVIIYQELYNRECLRRGKNVELHDVQYCAGYLSETFSKRAKEGKWSNRKVYIQIGDSAEKQRDLRVMGDYIITVDYSQNMLKGMKFVFENSYNDSQLTLQRLGELKGDVSVIIKKDVNEAKHLKNRVFRNIAQGDFKGLIKDLSTQKANGNPLVAEEKYGWVSKAQVDLVHDFENKQRGVFLDNSDLRFLISNIKTHTHKNLEGGDSLALIDLGVGPAIKPISLLPDLTTKFKTVEYIGVDYSRRVLKAAEEHLSRYQFLQLKPKFLQLDLHTLGLHPEALMSQIISEKRIFLLVGMTYGIFDLEDVKGFVSKMLKPGDLFIVDDETLTTKKQAVEISPRYPEQIYFIMQSLYGLGFFQENFDVNHIWNEKTSSIEMFATLKSIPDFLIPQVENIGLEVGDKIRIFRARKPSPKEFKKEIESLHEDLDVEVITEGTYSIALCKVK